MSTAEHDVPRSSSADPESRPERARKHLGPDELLPHCGSLLGLGKLVTVSVARAEECPERPACERGTRTSPASVAAWAVRLVNLPPRFP